MAGGVLEGGRQVGRKGRVRRQKMPEMPVLFCPFSAGSAGSLVGQKKLSEPEPPPA